MSFADALMKCIAMNCMERLAQKGKELVANYFSRDVARTRSQAYFANWSHLDVCLAAK